MDNSRNTRLKKIQEHWQSLELTQYEAARLMGISQPCFNQYIKGRIKLNTDTVIKFATLFKIPPSRIDPRII